jgi:hypothetical protein
VTLSFLFREHKDRLPALLIFSFSLDGRKGEQASSEDLLPLGYREWERDRVRVKPKTIHLPLTPSRQGREKIVMHFYLLKCPIQCHASIQTS